MNFTELESLLQKQTQDAIASRIRTWLEYDWSKTYLPALVDEITKKIRVEVMTNANIPEELRIRVRFDKAASWDFDEETQKIKSKKEKLDKSLKAIGKRYKK